LYRCARPRNIGFQEKTARPSLEKKKQEHKRKLSRVPGSSEKGGGRKRGTAGEEDSGCGFWRHERKHACQSPESPLFKIGGKKRNAEQKQSIGMVGTELLKVTRRGRGGDGNREEMAEVFPEKSTKKKGEK